MTLTFPPLPEQDVPVIVLTSATYDTDDWGDPTRHGINPATDWWCEVVLRTRRGDARASLFPPGVGRHQPLIEFFLGAEDLYEAEAVGHRTIRMGRSIATLLTTPDDPAAWQALKGQGLPDGYPKMIKSWLQGVDYLGMRFEPLTLEGAGRGGDLWTISMVAKYLGYTGPSANGSARKQLSRWGITSQGREPGRRGQSQYLADEVKAARASAPGKGRHGASRERGRFTGVSGE